MTILFWSESIVWGDENGGSKLSISCLQKCVYPSVNEWSPIRFLYPKNSSQRDEFGLNKTEFVLVAVISLERVATMWSSGVNEYILNPSKNRPFHACDWTSAEFPTPTSAKKEWVVKNPVEVSGVNGAVSTIPRLMDCCEYKELIDSIKKTKKLTNLKIQMCLVRKLFIAKEVKS